MTDNSEDSGSSIIEADNGGGNIAEIEAGKQSPQSAGSGQSNSLNSGGTAEDLSSGGSNSMIERVSPLEEFNTLYRLLLFGFG